MKRKFSDDEVRELRQAHRDGVSVYRLARLQNVPYDTMHKLIRRYSYADVPDPTPDPSVVQEPKEVKQTLDDFLSSLIGGKSA